ncbi:unnamed protein product, partial [Brassica napus]
KQLVNPVLFGIGKQTKLPERLQFCSGWINDSERKCCTHISLFGFGVQVSQFITFNPNDTYQRNIFFLKMDCLCLMSDKMTLPVHFFNKTLDLAFGIIPKIQINFKME